MSEKKYALGLLNQEVDDKKHMAGDHAYNVFCNLRFLIRDDVKITDDQWKYIKACADEIGGMPRPKSIQLHHRLPVVILATWLNSL